MFRIYAFDESREVERIEAVGLAAARLVKQAFEMRGLLARIYEINCGVSVTHERLIA